MDALASAEQVKRDQISELAKKGDTEGGKVTTAVNAGDTTGSPANQVTAITGQPPVKAGDTAESSQPPGKAGDATEPQEEGLTATTSEPPVKAGDTTPPQEEGLQTRSEEEGLQTGLQEASRESGSQESAHSDQPNALEKPPPAESASSKDGEDSKESSDAE